MEVGRLERHSIIEETMLSDWLDVRVRYRIWLQMIKLTNDI